MTRTGTQMQNSLQISDEEETSDKPQNLGLPLVEMTSKSGRSEARIVGLAALLLAGNILKEQMHGVTKALYEISQASMKKFIHQK